MASASLVPEVTIQPQGYAGGLNIRDVITLLAPDEARVMENGQLDEKGGFGKRLGSLSYGTFGVGADRALSAYTFYRGLSSPQVLLQTTAGKLYYTNDATANPITWTQITTGLSATAPMSFESFNSKVYFSNGVDNYASWDGTTYTTYPTAPKGKFLRLWKDTMWVSGVVGVVDRVYSSNPGDAETYAVASWVDIAKGDGDQVTALGSDGMFLIVFKRSRYFIIYDPVTFANRVVDYEKGCESHFSVIQHEGDIFFLSRRGICKYLSDSPSVIISGKLDPLFDPSVINIGALSIARAYVIGNQVGWAIPEVGFTWPTMQVEYYPRLAPISSYGYRGIGPFVFHRIPASIFFRWRWQGNDFLFGAGMTTNKVYRLFAPVGDDDGVAFVGILETGVYDFGARTRTKYIRYIRVLGRGTLTCQLKRNMGISVYKTFPIDLTSSSDTWNVGDFWGSGTWGPDSVLKETRVHADAYGRYFQLRFIDARTDIGHRQLLVGSKEYILNVGEWGVYGVTLEADILGMRD